jgi:hypothetical protein
LYVLETKQISRSNRWMTNPHSICFVILVVYKYHIEKKKVMRTWLEGFSFFFWIKYSDRIK